jgi:hypothetical protein
VTWVLAGIVLLALVLLIARWYADAEPRDVLKALRIVGALFAIGVIALVVVSGKVSLLWMVLLGLLPWMRRLKAYNAQAKDLRGPAKGQQVDLRTAFVVIYRNPETGDMDGRVLQGPNRGKLLSELSIDALVTLYEAAVIEDRDSALAIEAYLDRMHGGLWRAKSQSASDDTPQPAITAGMSRAEAYDALGLQPGASRGEIERACEHLLRQGHPNETVAREIAEKVARAKAILLEE